MTVRLPTYCGETCDFPICACVRGLLVIWIITAGISGVFGWLGDLLHILGSLSAGGMS